MKSRIQHEDDDDIMTKLSKRETVALTVEYERYIPPDSVRLQSSVPSSDHLDTSCKMHPQSTSDQLCLYGNRDELYLGTMKETYTPFSRKDALVCSAAAAPFRVRWKTPAASVAVFKTCRSSATSLQEHTEVSV
jgi:hypothetical protein